jgi:hypothetical protein
MTDNQPEAFDRLWRDAVEEHVAGMSEDDFRSMVTRARPPAEPLDPVSQARAEAEQHQSAGRAMAQQLMDMTAASNERVRQRMSLSPTLSDQAAAAEAARQAAAAEPQQPQGFTVNRAQGQSGSPAPPAVYSPQQKAEQLHQLSQPRPR